MKHYGDVTKIDGHKVELVDCVSFGSPCQDLSIAGARKGLAGERSGLFMESVRIIKELREQYGHDSKSNEHLRNVRYAIWENVDGAFSSNSGEDFRVVLEELARVKEPSVVIPRLEGGARWTKSGYIEGNSWSIAWREFEAKFWGVPQRRKRICVLLDMDGHTAGEILLCDDAELLGDADSKDPDRFGMGSADGCEREVQPLTKGLHGNFESIIAPWKGVARCPKECSEDGDRECTTLKLRHTGSDTTGGGTGAMITKNLATTLSSHQDQTLF